MTYYPEKPKRKPKRKPIYIDFTGIWDEIYKSVFPHPYLSFILAVIIIAVYIKIRFGV